MPSTLNKGVFNGDDRASIFAAAKAEYLKRMTGRVIQGSSAAQSYGLTVMDTADLIRLINGLADELGISDPVEHVRPNFNRYGGQQAPCGDPGTPTGLVG
jgi:hypothetical protein